MRMHRMYRVVPLLLLAVASACSQHEMASSDMAGDAEAASVGEAAPAAAPSPPRVQMPSAPAVMEDEGVAPSHLASDALVQIDPQRRFIRTAQAGFQVRDVYKTALAIEDEVAAQGGFVVDNDIRAQVQRAQSRSIGNGRRLELSEYRLQGELVVRVPSERTQAFLRAIAAQMEFLERRNFHARDAQFDLLRQQLARQRAQDTQQELGAAVQAGGRLGDKADAIQSRGAARASRDEALIAQKEFEDRVAFSTITLSLRQDAQVRKAERVDVDAMFRDNGPGFFRRLGDALAVGWRGGLEAVVALAALWPLWLVVFAVVSGWRWWRRKPAAA